jgi:Tol biopolymer transport system component
MTPEKYLIELLTLPWISPWLRPQVSRNGKWVAWTWFGTGPAGDVYLASTDGLVKPVRLSKSADRTLLVSWTPDSKGIIVAQDKGGNERFQLLRIDIERPLWMVPFTEVDPSYFLRGGDLQANDRWLVYGANYDFERDREIEPTWVYRHDLESGERKVLAKPGKGAYLRPRLSPDGRFILYNRKDLHPAGQQVWVQR